MCDWLLHLALPTQVLNNYTLSMRAQVKFTERTADKVADSHTSLTSRELFWSGDILQSRQKWKNNI